MTINENHQVQIHDAFTILLNKLHSQAPQSVLGLVPGHLHFVDPLPAESVVHYKGNKPINHNIGMGCPSIHFLIQQKRRLSTRRFDDFRWKWDVFLVNWLSCRTMQVTENQVYNSEDFLLSKIHHTYYRQPKFTILEWSALTNYLLCLFW